MEKIYKTLLKQFIGGFMFLCVFLNESDAQWSNYYGMPIAFWDFQNTANNPNTFQTTVKQQVNNSNTFDGKFGGANQTTSGVAGDGIAVYGGTHSGKGLSAGYWSGTTSDPGASATTYYQFSLNTTGFTGIDVAFDCKGTGGFYWPFTGISYSTNGGATWNAGTPFFNGEDVWTPANSYSLPNGANNNANLKIRIYGWWSNNSSGCTLVLDNLIVLASGTVANAGTLNLLNEQDIITAMVPGFTGYSYRSSFTEVGPNTNVVVNNNYNTVYGSPYYSEIGMNSGQTFSVTSNSTVTFGNKGDITYQGAFNLNSGSTLVTAHPNGISVNGNSTAGNGSVTISGTKTFNAGANYTYNGAAAQITNGGLPTSLTANLTINNAAGVTLTNSETTSGTVTLTNGALILNSNTLTVTNTAITAVTYAAGYIQSETNLATNPSVVTWDMAAGSPLSYVFPFGASGSQLPFTFNKTTGGTVNVSVSTRHTGADNTPFAGASDLGTVPAVSNMSCQSGGNATTSVIDRWWDIYASAAVTADLTFSYLGSEDATMNIGYQLGTIMAQHWNGAFWDTPVGGGVGVNGGVGSVTVSGANTFSPWVLVSSSNPLPIELVTFATTCTGSNIAIEWATASEINNDYFTVQRSPNGLDFEDLLRVSGSGNSNQLKHYSAMDNAPLDGNSYYRLKQTDYNGNYTYSPIVINDCSATGFNIVSIVTDQDAQVSKLNFIASDAGIYTVSVYDVLGKQLISNLLNSKKGFNRVDLNFSELKHAIYFVVLRNDKETLSRKLVY